MALSSALKATIALLFIVIVVVVVVTIVVVTIVVVVVVTVVVVVVGIGMSAPTILSQMTNPLAVIAPRPGLCSASYSIGFDYSWKDPHSFFSFLPDIQHRHRSYPPSTQL
ncbi:hypothetical protein Tco_0625242 [Tanacetum coccineum]|uniref:Transmembrane protein n=1 Tax=Tanacetum coccineum TaxID=301880 RepID=A0ABQ4WGC8_9ASTR